MGGQTADVRGLADFSKERCDFLLKDDTQTSDVRCSAEKNGFYLSPAFCAHNKVCIVENGAKVVIGMCDVSDQELIKRIRRVFDISEFGEKKLELYRERDRIKRQFAREHGYRLLVIPWYKDPVPMLRDEINRE